MLFLIMSVVTAVVAVFLIYPLFKIIRRYVRTPTFKNKTIWITGASSGIGQYYAYQFSRLQADLIISARNVKELERVKAGCSHPDKVKVVSLDMTNYEQIRKVSAEVLKQLQSNNKKLDILIENAGVSMRCLFRQYDFNNHVDLFNINVHGPFLHIQCVIQHMIKNKNGHIVGVTSLSGKMPSSHRSSYAGSKSAFIAILDSIRSQLHKYNINVTNLMPGYVNTNLSKNAFSSGAGQKLGFTDKNLQNGMSADTFAKISARAIFNKQNQIQISGLIIGPLFMTLRNVCPDLVFLVLRKDAKKQAEAIGQKSD